MRWSVTVTRTNYINENKGKEHIINLALGYQLSQVLFAALHMDIFNLLDRGEMNSTALTSALQSDGNSVRRLLNVLVDIGLLEYRNKSYRNTPLASRYLVKGKSAYLGNFVKHASNLWHVWDGLENQVKTGCGKEPGEDYLNAFPERLKDYLGAMQDCAASKAQIIADVLSIGKFREMLDIGCGPGTYAIAFAERNPDLTATLIDLEPNLVYAREHISNSSARERISTCTCQVLEDAMPGGGYDLVFISNLIHIYSVEEVRQIVAKAWDVLAPSGTLVIHDYILSDQGQGGCMASLFDLTMLVGTPRGRCYSLDEVKTLFMTLGAHTIRQINVDLGSSLVVGEKECSEKIS
jgi:SAM-dependent methyltransferase